jgi:hypothetical protein
MAWELILRNAENGNLAVKLPVAPGLIGSITCGAVNPLATKPPSFAHKYQTDRECCLDFLSVTVTSNLRAVVDASFGLNAGPI